MPVQPAIEAYTVQDYQQWPGDWELIHGQPVAMARSPGFDHLRLSAAAFRQLDESLDECPYCQAAFAIDVELAQDTVARPDVQVLCYQPEGERLTRAPDLIFEVISPRTAHRDEVVKFDLYRAEGVSHYVLVYPEAKKAKVRRLVQGEYRKAGDFHDQTCRFELSRSALDFDFGRLWKRKGGQALRPPNFDAPYARGGLLWLTLAISPEAGGNARAACRSAAMHAGRQLANPALSDCRPQPAGRS